MTVFEEMLSQELKTGNRNSKEPDSNLGIHWKRKTNVPGTDLRLQTMRFSTCFRKRAE
jgi:hypothetical protein